MKKFVANRLSGGNRIFPSEISIDNFGVTVKIPGFFSGREKSLSFDTISSVRIDCPLVGFSSITLNTIGFDRVSADGFSKDDAEEIKELIQIGIQSIRGSVGELSFSSNVTTETNEHDVELERLRLEKEQQDLTLRMIKGQRLRDKNRPFAAWLTELDPLYTYGLGLLILATFTIMPVISGLIVFVLVLIVIQEATKISWKKIGIGIAVLFLLLVGYALFLHHLSN